VELFPSKFPLPTFLFLHSPYAKDSLLSIQHRQYTSSFSALVCMVAFYSTALGLPFPTQTLRYSYIDHTIVHTESVTLPLSCSPPFRSEESSILPVPVFFPVSAGYRIGTPGNLRPRPQQGRFHPGASLLQKVPPHFALGNPPLFFCFNPTLYIFICKPPLIIWPWRGSPRLQSTSTTPYYAHR